MSRVEKLESVVLAVIAARYLNLDKGEDLFDLALFFCLPYEFSFCLYR